MGYPDPTRTINRQQLLRAGGNTEQWPDIVLFRIEACIPEPTQG
jgi:hypothetical protein